ncbi:MAG: Crp/Fnr family transcriptional regulator [Candidatus Dormibacteria bacterium]
MTIVTSSEQAVRPAPSSWRGALEHPLFTAVRADQVEPILREMPPRRAKAGKLLSWPGAAPAHLHLVLSGRLQSYLLNSNGHQLLLEIIEPGGMDGLMAVSGQPGHFIQVMSDSVVVSIAAPQLERLVAAEPRIWLTLVGAMAARIQTREEQMESMASRGAAGLARLLLLLAKAHGNSAGQRCGLELRLTHQMLADMLGVRRETVTVQWPSLISSGAVEMVDGSILLDRLALRRLAEHEVDLHPSVEAASS